MAHGPKLARQLFLCGLQAKNESDILKQFLKIKRRIFDSTRKLYEIQISHIKFCGSMAVPTHLHIVGLP